MPAETPNIAALVERLSALQDDEGCWKISAEDAAGLLGIDMVDFWRAVNAVKERISFSDAIDGWTQDTVGDLVTVMEELSGTGPEEHLSRAGLFIPHELGVELIDELLWKARSFAAAHEIRSEELAAMLRYAGSVRTAVRMYLESCADIDALVGAGAESFRVLHGMPARGALTARRYLRGMVARHVVDGGSLLAGLQERLVLEAARLGYVDPEDRPGADTAEEKTRGRARAPSARFDRRAWARRVMGLDGQVFTADDLRRAYRRLMMRHHPDIDPTGLETCKDVNVAYACLISDLRG